MGIIIIIVFLVLVAIIFVIATSSNSDDDTTRQKEVSVEFTNAPPPSGRNKFSFSIAGVNYRCTLKDVGSFIGMLVPEPNNPHDPNAVAVVNQNGKRLGYVGKSNLSELYQWSKGRVCPCVGYITSDYDYRENKNYLIGHCTAIYPSTLEECQKQADEIAERIVREQGPDFALPETNQ